MQNTHLSKWKHMILIACAVFLTVAGLFLTSRYVMNRCFLRDYAAENYTDRWERPLLRHNFPEGWLPLYHMGNVSYQLEDYDAAVSWYQQALNRNPPAEEKECAVRINLALALLREIDYEHLDTESGKDAAIQQLRSARSVLTEHGCADPSGTSGHSPEAEQLKKEIDELLQELQAEQPQDQGQQEQEQQEQQEQDQQDNDRQETQRERKIREKLDQSKKQAAEEQADAQQRRYERETSDGGGMFDGKTW